jgi:hypothetical protein
VLLHCHVDGIWQRCKPAGFFMAGGNGRMLGAALVFIIVIIGWVLGHMVPFFMMLKAVGLLRVPEVWI